MWHLDRNRAAVLAIVGQVNGSGSASPQLLDDLVVAEPGAGCQVVLVENASDQWSGEAGSRVGQKIFRPAHALQQTLDFGCHFGSLGANGAEELRPGRRLEVQRLIK